MADPDGEETLSEAFYRLGAVDGQAGSDRQVFHNEFLQACYSAGYSDGALRRGKVVPTRGVGPTETY